MNRYMKFLNVAAVVGAMWGANNQPVQASWYSCQDSEWCPNSAACNDDLYRWTAECTVQCEHIVGGGQTNDTGSASCDGVPPL